MIRFLRESLRDLLRYARGGDPIPEALEAQAQFLSNREELSSEKWIADALGSVNVRPEIVAFAYEFFASFNIPVGKIRCSDRLKDDLHFKEALQDVTRNLRPNSDDALRGIYGNGRTSRRWVTCCCFWTDEHKTVEAARTRSLYLASAFASLDHPAAALRGLRKTRAWDGSSSQHAGQQESRAVVGRWAPFVGVAGVAYGAYQVNRLPWKIDGAL